MALSSVLQTIPTSTRTVGTVEDRHGQNRGTTMGLKDTKTSVSEDIEDKGNTFNTSRGVSHHHISITMYIVVVSIIDDGNQITGR